MINKINEMLTNMLNDYFCIWIGQIDSKICCSLF